MMYILSHFRQKCTLECGSCNVHYSVYYSVKVYNSVYHVCTFSWGVCAARGHTRPEGAHRVRELRARARVFWDIGRACDHEVRQNAQN